MRKLWDKGYEVAADIEAFTVGLDRELDIELAPWDILGTLAHIAMLEQVGLLAADELPPLQAALRRLYATARAGQFVIEPGVEDVHSQVELLLTRELGDLGKKVHSGRSRNDQVLLDLKLYFLDRIRSTVGEVQTLFDTLLRLSAQYQHVLLPGYTHFQVAMPSSFGLWFGAYAESLIDDVWMLHSAWQVADQNPLGSAAGYGSSFPLDRALTTRLLGFSDLAYNVVYAQMGRGKTERALAGALASIGATLNKLATDVCLYMSQNFGFVSFPDELTTGSSIMPHKKNPDVFELLRARSNRLQNLPGQIAQVCSNLPSGYHRDFQLLKELVLPALGETRTCLHICDYMLGHIRVREGILDDPMYDYLFTVEAVNREVLAGVPFRAAYRHIGEQVQQGTFQPRRDLHHTHAGSIGQLCHDEIRAKMTRALSAFDFQRFDAAVQGLVG
ncbi:MAG: argininosuccinate lyase [Bacteroidia bacterium]